MGLDQVNQRYTTRSQVIPEFTYLYGFCLLHISGTVSCLFWENRQWVLLCSGATEFWKIARDWLVRICISDNL